MSDQTIVATNANSSGIVLDRKTLKALGKRRDLPGLIWLAQWVAALAATGYLVSLSLGSWWIVPAMVAYGTVLVVPAYSVSHETAHGTAFRTRWLNELVLWISSLIYFEEPYHRRYAHRPGSVFWFQRGLANRPWGIIPGRARCRPGAPAAGSPAAGKSELEDWHRSLSLWLPGLAYALVVGFVVTGLF